MCQIDLFNSYSYSIEPCAKKKTISKHNKYKNKRMIILFL